MPIRLSLFPWIILLALFTSCQSPLSQNGTTGDLWASDWSLNLYRQTEHRSEVQAFYAEVTGDPEVAYVILQACDAENVPPLLAFALVSTESGFNPKALGYNRQSKDYGLFQLNSKTYPLLKPDQAFNPALNAQIGAAHLREALERAENLPEALAMYNAGPSRVERGYIPLSTRLYVEKIMTLKDLYETRFLDHVLSNRVLAEGMKSSKAPGSLLDTSGTF